MRRWIVGVAVAAAAMAVEGDGSTPLLRAAYSNDVAEVRRLLRSGADANAANDLGATPLWAASLEGSVPVVDALLAAGANPNVALLAGESPLMVAARGGHVEIVQRLLAKGADPDRRAARGQTALMWAASRKHPRVVALLLGAKVDVGARSESWSQMMAVPPHGYPGYNKLIPHGADTALLFAARSGDLESAKLLVAAGADVNDRDAWGVSAVAFAAHSGFTDLALFLLDKGADASADAAGFAPLHIALMRRDQRLIRALIEHGANPEAPLRTWTPTRRSSRDSHFAPQLVGVTPLWLAARFLQPEAVRLLASKGANAKFVHRAEYVAEKGFKTRTESAGLVMAALGAVNASPWVQPSGKRADLVLETVRAVVEAGAEIPSEAVDAARRAGFDAAAEYLGRGRR